MGRSREYNYYYDCKIEAFTIDADSERITIDHAGDSIVFAFYEISEVAIDLWEDNDYILHIRCCLDTHYFQFVNKKDALNVCIEILNQISLLPERHDISKSS
jgi:hypothetical protein